MSKKNIIIIVIDDIGYNDLGYMGSELYTPNLNLMASAAIKFTQFYGANLCTPARASLMTGLYGYKTGAQETFTKWSNKGLTHDFLLLPQLLKNHGYKNYIVGKWHLGAVTSEHLPTNRGFDYHFGSYYGMIDYWKKHIPIWHVPDNTVIHDLYQNNELIYEQDHITELQVSRIVSKINHHNKDEPFLFYMPFNAPHAPHDKDQCYPYFLTHLGKCKNLPLRKFYGALLTHLDYCIGKIIIALKNKKLYNDTYIWVTGDNGGEETCVDNTPFRGFKPSFYEGGIRVPNFILGPKISNHYDNKPHHMVDMIPTIFEILKLPLTEKLDGISVFAKQPVEREFVYYLKPLENDFYGSIRIGDYKILKFKNIELYDVIKDRSESNNLSDNMPIIRDRLINRMKSLIGVTKFMQ